MSEADSQLESDQKCLSIKCEQCHLQPFKYKCPGCMVRTCSLECSKRHKTDTGCSGKRDKTKFVKRAEYDDNTLMSDYGFLLDMARDHSNLAHEAESLGVKALARLPQNNHSSLPPKDSNSNAVSPKVVLIRAQKNIYARAKGQRQVHIKYMSPGIKRSKLNKTIWSSKLSRLVWTIEFVVPELEPESSRWVENGFHDVCRLGDLWTRLLEFSPSRPPNTEDNDEEQQKKRPRTNITVRIQLPSDDGTEHPFRSEISLEMLNSLKQRFGSISKTDLVWLIRIQDTPANKPTFCKIDPTQPLFTQLRHQTVLEFPTIYVYSQAPSKLNGHDVLVYESHTSNDDAAIQTTDKFAAEEDGDIPESTATDNKE